MANYSCDLHTHSTLSDGNDTVEELIANAVKEGVEIIPCEYELSDRWSSYNTFNKDGIAEVTKDGKWGLINKEGIEIIPCRYDNEMFLFSEDGIAQVKRDGKWGYVNKDGVEIIPCIYDAAEYFHDGKAKVELNGKSFRIDKEGKKVKWFL